MYLKLGSYTFPDRGVELSIDVSVTDDAQGKPATERHTWSVRGKLIPTSTAGVAAQQAELQSLQQGLEQAVRQAKLPDLTFHRDDGNVYHQMKNITALSGVKRRNGPSYLEWQGAECVNYRTFALVFEADYPVAGTGGVKLVSFQERVSYRGGGPIRGWCRPVNKPPIRQTLYTDTPYEAIQSGTAVALGGYPLPPSPLWPAVDRDTPLDGGEPVFDGPKQGPRGVEFTVSWNYRFSAVRPLFAGRPTPLLGSG